MGAVSMNFRLSSVVDLDEVNRADPESFHFLVAHLKSKGYQYSKDLWRAQQALPSLDKFAWRSNSRVLSGLRFDNRFHMHSIAVMHEGIHSLASTIYGNRLKGRPRFTLLVEALASCLTPYVMFIKLQRVGLTPEIRDYLDSVRGVAKILRLPYSDLFVADAQEPFAAYRRNVLEMNDVYEFLLKRVASNRVTIQAINKFCHSKKSMFYIQPFDFGNQVLYAQVNCGLKSSARDLEICAEIKRKLRRSDSMDEFLRLLAK